MRFMVAHSKFLLDNTADTSAGPSFTQEPIGFRPVPKQVRNLPQLLGGEPSGAASAGPRQECLLSLFSRHAKPLADGSLRDIERLGYLRTGPPFLCQFHGS
jgi:hypothetical protein